MELELRYQRPTEREVRWSKDNIMGLVPCEPLPDSLQAEIEKILEASEEVG
jgi:hypothetical protein